MAMDLKLNLNKLGIDSSKKRKEGKEGKVKDVTEEARDGRNTTACDIFSGSGKKSLMPSPTNQ